MSVAWTMTVYCWTFWRGEMYGEGQQVSWVLWTECAPDPLHRTFPFPC